MPRQDAPPLTRGVVLRGFGMTLAIGLGAVAVWLIVTNPSRKMLELGVVAGLWSALIGAFAMFGARRPHEAPPPRSTELEITARRDFEERLQQLLRREIDSAVTREVSALRTDITQLRQELLDKVGGQLRLERIEVTRVIGSDLEALQDEVRQLKSASAALTAARVQVVEPARIRPALRGGTIEQLDDEPAVEVAVEPPVDTVGPAVAPAVEPGPSMARPATPPPRAATSAPVPPEAAQPQPAQRATVQPEPVPAERAQPEPVATRVPPPPPPARVTPVFAPAAEGSRDDPFASLPRLSPFTDFDLDPVDSEPSYAGRRRREPPHEEAPPAGGRRRRTEDAEDNNLLARLLAREASR